MSTPFIVRALPTTRLVTLGFLLFCSLVGLGASAAFVSLISSNGGVPDARAGFAVAVPVITLIFVGPMLIIDLLRRGAFTSMILVELPILGLLFVFWLADAASQSTFLAKIQPVCGITPNQFGNQAQVDLAQKVCTDIKLTVAFGWLAWIPLLGYFVTLLTMTIIGAQRGAPVWKSSVRECDFGYGNSSKAEGKSEQLGGGSFVTF